MQVSKPLKIDGIGPISFVQNNNFKLKVMGKFHLMNLRIVEINQVIVDLM